MPNLMSEQRRSIINELLARHEGGVLRRGAQAEVARLMGSKPPATSKIWARYHATATNGISGGEWESRIKLNSGRKPVSREEVVAKLRALPLDDRQNTRRAAEAAGVSRNLVRSLLKEGTLHRALSRIKPLLTPEQKLARVETALALIGDSSLQFEPLKNVVHIDEKRFNADKNKRSCLLFEGERPQVRATRSKNYIPKTMFLAAVARPRFDPHRNCTWDGKLDIWAFSEEYGTERTSKYRSRGTVCTRNIASVNREVCKEYLLKYVIPAIKEKWPRRDCHRPIFIQQDNAKPHVPASDPDTLAAGMADGWCIRLICQPANSPDYNVLDLGLFASIQTIQYQHPIYTVEKLIAAVKTAYKDMDKQTLDNVFLTLQACMLCTLEEDGGNTYTLPHLAKDKPRNAGKLPRVLTYDAALYHRANQLRIAPLSCSFDSLASIRTL